MSGLTWLHLSDWHQRLGEFDRKVVLDSLLEDIRERTRKVSPDLEHIDLIIFSGDIANKGKKEEYDSVITHLLDPLLEITGVPPSRLFIIPGNHDLDRTSFELLPEAILRPFTSTNEVQEWLNNKRKLDRLLEPFQAFTDFVNSYTGRASHFANVAEFEIAGKRIALLGINSALMCGRNKDPNGEVNDYGYLAIGEPQIHDALKQIADFDLRIAVMHHPFQWLSSFERSVIENRLRKNCHFILHGHEHEPNVSVQHGTVGDCIIIPAGASYDRREPEASRYANGYNFVHLDFTTGEGTAYLRKYEDRQGWIKDTGTTGEDTPGTVTFLLPKNIHNTASLPTTPDSRKSSRSRSSSSEQNEDWGMAPDVSIFYGRDSELADLQQWITKDHCRVVGVFGMGGMGKSLTATKLAKHISTNFDYVIWMSLLNAPPANDIIAECIHFLSNQQEIELPENTDKRIARLLDYLRTRRCLIVLDNFDTVFCKGQYGQYLSECEAYGHLIQSLGSCDHQSCLLLTSREKPSEFALLEGLLSSVRSLELTGLDPDAAQKMLKDKKLTGTNDAWVNFVNHYSGNPLTLKLVAEPIRVAFDGDVVRFMDEGAPVFNEVYEVLDRQFERLSILEQNIMYWLSIEREPVSRDELRSDFVRPIKQRYFFDALKSLRRRSLIDRNGLGFTLQNVVREYMTDRFVNNIINEISLESYADRDSHINNYAIIKAQGKEYVRDSQIRLMLNPIMEGLLDFFEGQKRLEGKLKQIVDSLPKSCPPLPGYAAGNVLNLLCCLGTDISGYDFSYLTVWQAPLRGISLHDVDFSYADLTKAVFTETFGTHLSVVFRPDGEVLATGTTYGEIRLWRKADGKLLQTLLGHNDWVRTVAFSPDGSILGSGGEDQIVRLWDLQSGRCIKQLAGHTNRIRLVAFSPDGTLLASCSSDQTIRLWEVSTGECLKILQGHTDWVRAVAFSPDGTLLASCSSDRTVRLWEVSTEECLKILQGHTNRVRAVAFSPDGTLLASCSGDQTIRLWDIKAGQCLEVLQGHTSQVWSIAFSPDGNTLASCSEDQTVRWWDISTGHCLKVLQGYTPPIWTLAFSTNGSILASAGGDQTVRLWDVTAGQCLKILRGHSSWIRSVAFSPDGVTLASGSDDQTIRLWNAVTGRALQVLEGHNNRVRSVAFSFEGNTLVSASKGQKIWLWNVATGKFLRILEGHTNPVWAVAFSSKRDLLASGSADQTVRLWDTSTGNCVNILRGHTNWIRAVAFSPDGNVVASGGEDKTVRLWSVATGTCVRVLDGHTERIWSVAFSPDGRILASGSDDHTVRLWDVTTGQCLRILQVQDSQIRAVAFGSDSNILASGSYGGTILIWNVQTGEKLRTLTSDRPYERMNITGAIGLTDALRATLVALGAVENALAKQVY